MKRFLTVLVILVLLSSLGLAAVVPAFSADTGVVQVTAEPAQVSVSVNPDNVSYGVVDMGQTGLVPSGDPMIMAQNTGNWWASFQIKGADTNGGWILSDTATPDHYVHYFGPVPQPPLPPGTVSYTPLGSTGYGDLGGVSYSPYQGVWFKLMMDTPTLSSATGTQTTTVTVMVTQEEEGLRLDLTTDNDTYEQGGGPVLMTANVTNQAGAPVSGLVNSLVGVNIEPYTPGTPPVIAHPITLTETDTGTGIYTGSLDISSLTEGAYSVWISTSDGSHFVGGGRGFTITP